MTAILLRQKLNIASYRVLSKIVETWMIVVGVVFSLFRPLVDVMTAIIFRLIRGKQKPLPPITNSILLLSATQLAERIRKKKVTSEEVMQAYITRAKEVHPLLNAMVDQRFNAALEEARAADQLIRSGKMTEEQIIQEKPLLGVPFSCKEAIGVTGLYQTCGLVERKGVKATKDAEVVKRYRRAGAIPFVSSNIPELCMWWESANRVYGIANNPYDYNRTPGGSSGGEGVLITSAASVIGLGNDIAGSIRIPAAFTGIFGHKPTAGAISNAGFYPEIEASLNKFVGTGPMCRYAEDLLPLVKILAEDDKRLRLNEKVNLKNVKFYYLEDDGTFLSSATSDIKKAVRQSVSHLQKKFGVQAQKADLPELKDSITMWGCKLLEGNPPPFAVEMANYKGEVNPSWEFIKWIFGRSDHTLPAIYFGMCEKRTRDASYYKALATYKVLEKKIKEMLSGDVVFLYPSHPEVPPHHHMTIPRMPNIGYTGIFSILGLPATQIPTGLSKGLPIGIQAIAAHHNDHLTLATALELEHVFKGWISPGPVHLKEQ